MYKSRCPSCKQIISYFLNDKPINDIKCKIFLSNTAGQLTEISDKICIEGKNNKLLSDTIVKNACINNKLLNDISTGIMNGIRKKEESDDIGTWDNKVFKREWNNGNKRSIKINIFLYIKNLYYKNIIMIYHINKINLI